MSVGHIRTLMAIGLYALLLAGCGEPKAVTGQIKPEMRAQYDMALQEMLNKPGDIAVALRYAKVAKASGDLDGAISIYEGLLITDSNLPEVRVELGLLYYRLKSYDVARSHLEAALQLPSLPLSLRKPTQQLLAKMPKQTPTHT